MTEVETKAAVDTAVEPPLPLGLADELETTTAEPAQTPKHGPGRPPATPEEKAAKQRD
jgi:hypothetical protein